MLCNHLVWYCLYRNKPIAMPITYGLDKNSIYYSNPHVLCSIIWKRLLFKTDRNDLNRLGLFIQDSSIHLGAESFSVIFVYLDQPKYLEAHEYCSRNLHGDACKQSCRRHQGTQEQGVVMGSLCQTKLVVKNFYSRKKEGQELYQTTSNHMRWRSVHLILCLIEHM